MAWHLMNPDDIPDENLLYIVGQADKELFETGMDIKRRLWEVPRLVMKRFGYLTYTIGGPGRPKILERIDRAFASIYRKQDLAVGGHIGVFMYRDIFARIAVPHVFGTVSINPFECIDLTPIQLRIIQSEPEEMQVLIDQFSDVADVQYGTQEIKSPFANIELVVRFIGLARLHLHSASAVLTGGYDFRGAVQSSLLATELALKAGAAANGMSEDQIKEKFGHNVGSVARLVATHWPSFDLDRVTRVIATQPKYVLNRYAASQPERRDVGHLVMGAQYIVSEIARQLSDRDFRKDIHPPFTRRYPA